MLVLLTGATGYIGQKLRIRLQKETNLRLRLFVKNGHSVSRRSPNTEVFEGSTFDLSSLDKALRGVDTAYYLIHSLGSQNFKELDRQSATNFVNACIKNKVKRIIYLGGLGEKETSSEHLLSRIETGEILSSRPKDLQTLWFRAGVIIGSGSASYEIIRNLVEKLPVMITPKWVETLCQPSAERDVIEYLAAALFLDTKENYIIDIGGEAMTYKELLLGYAREVELKRILISVPFFSPKLSSYWLTLITPVPYSVASALVEGLKSKVVITNDNAKKLFPHIVPISYSDAIKETIKEIQTDQVISRWSDAAGDAWEVDHSHIADALFIDRQIVSCKGELPKNVYAQLCGIGGKNGWFSNNFLWKVRGVIDKIFGGYGLSRGRRDARILRIGDSVDFWKVVDIKKNERLLLFSQMRLPGRAWLEWLIKDGNLIQSAYFYPRGLLGRIYWYAMFPFHWLVFSAMARNIIKKSHQ